MLAAGQLAVIVGIQATLIGAGVVSLALAAWGLARAGAVRQAQLALGAEPGTHVAPGRLAGTHRPDVG